LADVERDPEKEVAALIGIGATIRAEYQRFYDFVAEADPALVDAWHFNENVRRAKQPPTDGDLDANGNQLSKHDLWERGGG
jgi:hypothetical protein